MEFDSQPNQAFKIRSPLLRVSAEIERCKLARCHVWGGAFVNIWCNVDTCYFQCHNKDSCNNNFHAL